MSLFKNKKRRFSFSVLVLISFSIMAAFSIFLHEHEFDPFSTDEDCAPCQWAQINVNVDSDIPSLDFVPIAFTNESKVGVFHYKNFKHTYFGLSPPAFS
jgi:hypothetical protein